MVIKQFGRTDIAQQHLHLLVPRHFLHLGDGSPGAGGLGEEPRAQRMATYRFRIEPHAARIFLDQPRDRTVRHALVGQPPLRVDLKKQRARAALQARAATARPASASCPREQRSPAPPIPGRFWNGAASASGLGYVCAPFNLADTVTHRQVKCSPPARLVAGPLPTNPKRAGGAQLV